MEKVIATIALLSLSSSNAFGLESGYQNIGRLQQWVSAASSPSSPAANVFLIGPGNPNSCNGTGIYSLNSSLVDSARGKNAIATILAAKMAGKKINFTYECSGGSPNVTIIQGVDVE